MDVQGTMHRVETARRRVDELKGRKNRLEGEVETHRRRMGEIEAKCREEYDCEVGQLPGMIEGLEREAEQAVAKAEELLNGRDDASSGQV